MLSGELATLLSGIYNTILIKDVAKREGITDVSLLESIVKFVASSIGSPISAKTQSRRRFVVYEIRCLY
ncbi:MAG: hypothetical protein RR768_02105, partial [Clostridium sp.]